MFRKIVSSLPFSPALVGQLGFYAKRLRKEEATRRLGLIFTALALIVQSFAVFQPPEAANASSVSDFIPGGFSNLHEYLNVYDRNVRNVKDIFSSLGITRSEIANSSKGTINSKTTYSWGMTSRFSAAQGERQYTYTQSNGNQGTVYYRPLKLWDSYAYTIKYGSTYSAYIGHSKKFGWFALMLNCGNLITKSPPPPPPQPSATCVGLSVEKLSRTKFRFNAKSSVKNGAKIETYIFTVKNSAGTVISRENVPSRDLSAHSAYEHKGKPGTFKAQVIVDTSAGRKTADTCIQNFTVTPPPSQPSISIDKKVDGVEQKTVGVNTEFTYQIAVTNTGDVALKNAKVTDSQPEGVTFLSASSGAISNGTWQYVIPTLAKGETKRFTITAKVPTYLAGIIHNTACVDTPDINGNPDDCDDANIDVTVPPKPVAVCSSVSVDIMDRTTISLAGSASVKNGATINKYTFVITDKDGKVIKKIEVPSSAETASVDSFILNTPGAYKVALTVATSLGDRTSTQDCTKQFTIAPPDKCPVNSKLDDTDPDCQPCPGDSTIWIKDERCAAQIVETKTATNITANKNASMVVAKSSDKISYTLTVQNRGLDTSMTTIVENLRDVSDYTTPKLFDDGGGIYDEKAKTLTWPTIELKPGEKQSRTFVVQLLDKIPATNTGKSDASSYDCKMTNTFGNSIDVKVACPVQKVAVEQVTRELPHTGPTENMIFAGVLLSVVTYFYARSRQVNKEVRLIRRDIHAGTI